MTATKCYVAFGSNLGNRRQNLERAARALGGVRRVSPVLETPALVPEGAPNEWRSLPFYNAVAEVEWTGSPPELLRRLKQIELSLGREAGPRWAPRVIDLDILTFGDLKIESEGLVIPHPAMNERAFVLSALKHLCLDGVRASRALGENIPVIMGIINLTPDSFSDGGANFPPPLAEWDAQNIAILDLGAESTRPGATPLTPIAEWQRLEPALAHVNARYAGQIFRPWVSVDTYHAETAARAIENGGVDMINDVGGLRSERMLEIVKQTQVHYVLMHSLTVPADSRVTVATEDVTREVKTWALAQLDRLDRAGVDLGRVLFDPGLGFGKTGPQSEALAREIERLMDLPVRLLSGHSRKSFLGGPTASSRDPETLGLSLQMVDKGVDVIRVHAAELHARVLRRYL